MELRNHPVDTGSHGHVALKYLHCVRLRGWMRVNEFVGHFRVKCTKVVTGCGSIWEGFAFIGMFAP